MKQKKKKKTFLIGLLKKFGHFLTKFVFLLNRFDLWIKFFDMFDTFFQEGYFTSGDRKIHFGSTVNVQKFFVPESQDVWIFSFQQFDDIVVERIVFLVE